MEKTQTYAKMLHSLIVIASVALVVSACGFGAKPKSHQLIGLLGKDKGTCEAALGKLTKAEIQESPGVITYYASVPLVEVTAVQFYFSPDDQHFVGMNFGLPKGVEPTFQSGLKALGLNAEGMDTQYPDGTGLLKNVKDLPPGCSILCKKNLKKDQAFFEAHWNPSGS